MSFQINRLKISRSQPRSSSKSTDPFLTLQQQGNRLKPVSPKMKIPVKPLRSTPNLPRPPKEAKDENEVETPRFSSMAKNSSTSNLKKISRRRFTGCENCFEFLN